VGNLIVGAADGFGGKLIRTVSFFGWTLPVSFFGGTAPAGTLGMFSAITFSNLKLTSPSVNSLLGSESVSPLAPAFAIAASTASATAPTSAAATAALFAWFCDIHSQCSALKVFIVELFDRLVRFFSRREFDKRETSRFACHLVKHHVHGRDSSSLRKIILEIGISGLVGQVADEKSVLVHRITSAQRN
jgi:hypothetical protein